MHHELKYGQQGPGIRLGFDFLCMINSEQRKKCNLKKLAELIHKAIEHFKQMKSVKKMMAAT